MDRLWLNASFVDLKDRVYGAELGDGYCSGTSTGTEERRDGSFSYNLAMELRGGDSFWRAGEGELGKESWGGGETGSEQVLSRAEGAEQWGTDL